MWRIQEIDLLASGRVQERRKKCSIGVRHVEYQVLNIFSDPRESF